LKKYKKRHPFADDYMGGKIKRKRKYKKTNKHKKKNVKKGSKNRTYKI